MRLDLITESEKMPEFSVVITCYFEENSIEEFSKRLLETFKSLNRKFEVIFVNDGSTDQTLNKLLNIMDTEPTVSYVLDLNKNYGQGSAMTAAIGYAKGQHFFFMDSDLQLDPEEIPLLLNKFDKGVDFVTGYRADRKDSIFRSVPSLLANVIMRNVAGRNLKDFGCNIKFLRGHIIRAYEFGPFKPWRLASLISHVQSIEEVPITHHSRKFGKSGWTFKKLWQYNMDNIVWLTDKPFQFLSILCLFGAVLVMIRYLVSWVSPVQFFDVISNGILLVSILTGFLTSLSVLAAIGEFVIRSFKTLQNEPCFIIRKAYSHNPSQGND